MKFTLLSKDELKFKIKQKWDFSVPEVIVDSSHCYKQIKYLLTSIKNYNPNRTCSWDRLMFLEIKKDKGTVIYEVEDIQLDFHGKGENPKVNIYSIQTAGYDNTVVPAYSPRQTLLYGWTGKELIFADEMNKFWDNIEEQNK